MTHIGRREFCCTVSGLGLSFSLPAMEPRAADQRGAERQKSLLMIWLDGGPSQLETWDPHPGSPIGGPTRAIPTSVAGVTIAAGFPNLAEQLHHLSIVRSLVSKEGDHARAAYTVKTGYRPDPALRHPSLGSILTHEIPNPSLEIPRFIALGPNPWPSRGGYLGGRYDAFHVYDPGRNAESRRKNDPRRDRRISNLQLLTKSFARGREIAVEETLHEENVRTVFKMMTSEHLQAFELEAEPTDIRSAYGDSEFGRACLVARRLIETGVRVVEVTLLGWDTHESNFTQTQNLSQQLDSPLAALLRDLTARDLLDSTILLCIGEFGRTPRINAKEGRDHWPTGFSCLVGGGGLRGGVVIGETDSTGNRSEPESPIAVADLYATILQTAGIAPGHQVVTPIGRPMKYSEGTPIGLLLGST